ncbi:unnamed protein product [Fusarium venenatum]|uniref:Uncharacterized protein n=1 Tax=Fusarium venenatum TaxID=56646 RepID=A0A2L2TCR0_9HYPO|nr:uncharacterized protein FVRRES_12013 [Fusarium venenatum]CEI39322.1 unnamed protein product [Fusarium venenatum]
MSVKSPPIKISRLPFSNVHKSRIHWVSRLASATEPLKYRNLQQLPSLSDVCLCEIHALRTLHRSELLQAMDAMLLPSQIICLRAIVARKRTSGSELVRQKPRSWSISDAGDSWGQVCLVEAVLYTQYS